jgi:hypothetical protein
MQNLLETILGIARRYTRIGWRAFLRYLSKAQTDHWSKTEFNFSNLLRGAVLRCLQDFSFIRQIEPDLRLLITSLLISNSVSLLILEVILRGTPNKSHIHGSVTRLKRKLLKKSKTPYVAIKRKFLKHGEYPGLTLTSKWSAWEYPNPKKVKAASAVWAKKLKAKKALAKAKLPPPGVRPKEGVNRREACNKNLPSRNDKPVLKPEPAKQEATPVASGAKPKEFRSPFSFKF